jgi:hypothetical protein
MVHHKFSADFAGILVLDMRNRSHGDCASHDQGRGSYHATLLLSQAPS